MTGCFFVFSSSLSSLQRAAGPIKVWMRVRLGVATLKSWLGRKTICKWKMKFGVHSNQYLHITITLCDLRYCSYFLCRYWLPLYWQLLEEWWCWLMEQSYCLSEKKKIFFRLVFYNNTLKWLMEPNRDDIEVKLLLHIACFSNRKKQKSCRMWKGPLHIHSWSALLDPHPQHGSTQGCISVQDQLLCFKLCGGVPYLFS